MLGVHIRQRRINITKIQNINELTRKVCWTLSLLVPFAFVEFSNKAPIHLIARLAPVGWMTVQVPRRCSCPEQAYMFLGGLKEGLIRWLFARERSIFWARGDMIGCLSLLRSRLDRRRATETGNVRQEKKLERGRVKVSLSLTPSSNQRSSDQFVNSWAVRCSRCRCLYFLLRRHLCVSFVFNLLLITTHSFTLYERFCSNCNLYTWISLPFFAVNYRVMQTVLYSITFCHLIAAACASTNLFSGNQDSVLENDLFSDETSGATVDVLDLQASNAIDSLNAGDSNWLQEDSSFDLASGTRSSSHAFPSDDSGLLFFTGSDSNSSPDILDWNLQSEPGLGSSLHDADLKFLDSSTDPNSLLQDSIWDDVNSPLADNYISCEVSLGDGFVLSGKRRRETQCKDPDQDQSSKNTGPDPSDPSPSPWAQENSPLNYAFSENFEICSERIFKSANFPVCKESDPPADQIYTEPQAYWAHLFDVLPSTSVHDLSILPVWIRNRWRKNKVVLFSAPSDCPTGQVVWCCELIQRRLVNYIASKWAHSNISI